MKRTTSVWRRVLLLAVGGWTLISVSCNPAGWGTVVDIDDDFFDDIDFFEDGCDRCGADFWWDGWGLEIFYDD